MCIAGILLTGSGQCYAQKYTFTHYDIEDGLIQSQVNKLSQDNEHRLWLATLGGACRYDGKEYYAVTKANGLATNVVYQVFVDKTDNVWFGTHKGLSCFRSGKVYNYPIPVNEKNSWVQGITQDGSGQVWVLLNSHLYRATGQTLQLNRPITDTVTCMAVDKQGALYTTVLKKGVFRLNRNVWKSYIPFTGKLQDAFVMQMVFDKLDSHKSYLLAYKGLFVANGAVAQPYNDTLISKQKPTFLSFAQDAENNLWIGTTSGAYYINQQKTIHFTADNGFTDHAVTDIYNDGDNNLWFATEGSGLYKFEGDSYVIYDQSRGINNGQIVMGIARDIHGNIIFGTDGNGLVKFSDGKFSSLMPLNERSERRIESLYTDKNKTLWIGTASVGAWSYDGKSFEQLKGIQEHTVSIITADDFGTLWLGTAFGCYYRQNNVLKKVQGISGFITSILPLGKDTVLIGTQGGVLLLINKKLVPTFKLTALNNSAIYCMLAVKGNVLFGTDDKGLFTWDSSTNKLRNYSIKDGFNSNSVYSLIADKHGIIWVGTGRGIKRVSVDPVNMSCTLLPDRGSKELIAEANQGASLNDGNKIIIGTTKGLIIYNTNITQKICSPPHVIIKSIKLFPQEGNQNQEEVSENTNLKLSSSENHLAISFLGVYLKNPEGVTYQYKLSGLNDKFCWPVKNNMVDYPSLPPGKYTFEVKAISPDGVVSTNTAKFSFEIVPPFYKTRLFTLGVIVFLISLGILLQSLRYHYKLQRQQAIEIIRSEEKLKIRQQTAEDFHDDLGNKLTRITILSEILNTKIDSEKTDQLSLVEQIRQNVAALYNGTKDILWALDPKSDNLFETMTHIKDIGVELFHDTTITFEFNGIDQHLKEIKLPMEYSRNVTMIFKELLTNILKHAGAEHVTIVVNSDEKDRISLTLTDDGKGFDYKNTARGHGINNIKARTTRIDAELLVFSESGAGTRAELKFSKNP